MTTSKAKAKGTGFEREVKNALGWPDLRRTAASCAWDLEVMGDSPVEVLVTRPDRGQPLVSMRLDDFAGMFDLWRSKVGPGLRVECKRYKSFAHHTIYAETYPSYRSQPQTNGRARLARAKTRPEPQLGPTGVPSDPVQEEPQTAPGEAAPLTRRPFRRGTRERLR